jgi:uncharacterized damage-inducible protein DinB
MDFKQLADFYIEEIKMENVSTRKCLERIPESVYKFKPHEKSMEMGYLTQLVAEIPKWISTMIKDSVIDLATYPHFKLSDTKALLQQYDDAIKDAIEALENLTEAQLKDEFTLKNNGQLLYNSPKLKSIGETINHWVHHRGQLTVYMRLNDILVPSIYGPSADERKF